MRSNFVRRLYVKFVQSELSLRGKVWWLQQQAYYSMMENGNCVLLHLLKPHFIFQIYYQSDSVHSDVSLSFKLE